MSLFVAVVLLGRLVSDWLDGRHSGKVHRKMFAPGDLILDARVPRFISLEPRKTLAASPRGAATTIVAVAKAFRSERSRATALHLERI